MTAQVLAAQLLARSGEGWKSGPLGLAVVLVLCVAAYFLFKSMSKHIKHLDENFPSDETPGPSSAAGPDGAQPIDGKHPSQSGP